MRGLLECEKTGPRKKAPRSLLAVDMSTGRFLFIFFCFSFYKKGRVLLIAISENDRRKSCFSRVSLLH